MVFDLCNEKIDEDDIYRFLVQIGYIPEDTSKIREEMKKDIRELERLCNNNTKKSPAAEIYLNIILKKWENIL